MSKAGRLLEEIKEVVSGEQKGTYSMEFEFTANLAKEVDMHPHSDEEDMMDVIFDDIVSNQGSLKKELEKSVWTEVKNIPGIGGMDMELDYAGEPRHPQPKSKEELKQILQNAKLKMTINLSVELDTDNKVVADNAIKKAIEGAL